MILPINDEYRIKGDKWCWCIQKSKIRKGEVTWVSISWFSSIENVVKYLGEMMIRTSDAQTLGEALTEVEKVSNLLSHALSLKFQDVRKIDINDDEDRDIK